MFQSFNLRSTDKAGLVYSLVPSTSAKELGRVELVGSGVAMPNDGPDNDGDMKYGGDISKAPGMKRRIPCRIGAFPPTVTARCR